MENTHLSENHLTREILAVGRYIIIEIIRILRLVEELGNMRTEMVH